jgi:hypothetical protein
MGDRPLTLAIGVAPDEVVATNVLVVAVVGEHSRDQALLHEAAAPHIVFRITDGANDDWASWYAERLVRLSGLPGPLGGTLASFGVG